MVKFIKQLYNIFIRAKSGDPHVINNWEMMQIVTAYRIFVLVALIWLSAFESMNENDFWGERGLLTQLTMLGRLSIIAVIYLGLIYIPLSLTNEKPLRVLNQRWFSIPACIEICLIVGLSWLYPLHEQIFVLSLILPIGVLVRFTKIISKFWHLSLVVFIPILFQTLAVYVYAIYYADNSILLLRRLWSDLLLITLVMIIVAFSLWRHSQQNENKLIRGNLTFAMTYLQDQTNSALSFLRVPAEYMGRNVLFLIMTAPHTAYRQHFYPDVIALDMERTSIVVTAYQTEKPELLDTQAGLRQNLMQTDNIRDYNLEQGMALPLLNKSGVTSFYFNSGSVRLSTKQRNITPQLKYLSQYLQYYDEQVSSWVQNIFDERLIPTGDWEEISRLTQEMFGNTHYWESSQLLVNGMTRIAQSQGACILFFDEETRNFRSTQNGYGVTDYCADELTQSVYSEQEIVQWLADRGNKQLSLHVPIITKQSKTDYCLAFPLRTKEEINATNKDKWKWLGLLLLDLKSSKNITLVKRRQLEIIALNGSTDLRNCQLHLRSETDRHAQAALNEIIQHSFSAEKIPQTERAFLNIVNNVLKQGLDEHHSTTLGILSSPHTKFDHARWITTSGIPWSYIDQKAATTRREIHQAIDSFTDKQKVKKFDYFLLDENQLAKYAIKQSYVIAIPLEISQAANCRTEELEMLIIYVNYQNDSPEHLYTTRRILNLLVEPLQQAWQMWHRWQALVDQERAHQREFWSHELHDQLNELQSKVMRPLEMLEYYLQISGLEQYEDRVQKIYKGAMGINTTLKQFNSDIRDQVYHQQGLVAGLKNLQDRIDEGYILDVEWEGKEPEPQISGPLYILSREAVVNAFKHGGNNVEIIGENDPKNGISLHICDNGPGFNGETGNGSGMGIMRYQAHLIGASIQWTTCTETGGTQVIVRRNISKKGN